MWGEVVGGQNPVKLSSMVVGSIIETWVLEDHHAANVLETFEQIENIFEIRDSEKKVANEISSMRSDRRSKNTFFSSQSREKPMPNVLKFRII